MDKHEYLMQIAEKAASRATCPDLKVGCVIATLDGHVLSMGYNGTAHGEKHCRQYHKMCLENGPFHRAVHAEANAVAHAAKKGIALEKTIAYVTTEPCGKCKTLLKQAGVEQLVIRGLGPLKPRPIMKTSEAQRKAAQKWNKAHPAHFKALSKAKYLREAITGIKNHAARQSKYGITKTGFNKMIKDQNGKCVICNAKFIKTPCVDHCHKTGKVRGLICYKCNYVLGFCGDNPTLLKSAITYLERHI